MKANAFLDYWISDHDESVCNLYYCNEIKNIAMHCQKCKKCRDALDEWLSDFKTLHDVNRKMDEIIDMQGMDGFVCDNYTDVHHRHSGKNVYVREKHLFKKIPGYKYCTRCHVIYHNFQ